jgi:hypothetical protein
MPLAIKTYQHVARSGVESGEFLLRPLPADHISIEEHYAFNGQAYAPMELNLAFDLLPWLTAPARFYAAEGSNSTLASFYLK